MNELISGREAIEAFLDGENVEFMDKTGQWRTMLDNTILKVFLDHDKFRLKPRTITINGIELPATFEPKDGEKFWHLYPPMERGYNYTTSRNCDHYEQFGAWRTEEEIKQVVSALRSIFK